MFLIFSLAWKTIFPLATVSELFTCGTVTRKFKSKIICFSPIDVIEEFSPCISDFSVFSDKRNVGAFWLIDSSFKKSSIVAIHGNQCKVTFSHTITLTRSLKMFSAKVNKLHLRHILWCSPSFGKAALSRLVLGIETSCDETGAAVMDETGEILGESLHSQKQIHLRWVSGLWYTMNAVSDQGRFCLIKLAEWRKKMQ